jgi:NADPH-dependent glutamate synthase beta subunit-like oxidoreductase
MAIPRIEHTTATSLDEARVLASEREGKAALVAGGTDLLGILKDNVHPNRPELLVDLKPIEELRAVEMDGQGLKVGALTTLTDVARHPIIREKFPLLAQAAGSVASPQIRNMGTVGGNLCQEPRCWYYRTPENLFHCMRKGGNLCGAVLGENRYHSLFGAARTSMPGCTYHCPGHVDIPLYLGKIREGDPDGAARVILDSNPMPAITGRVCSHPCQPHCSRAEFDEAVSTRSVERYLGDYVLDHAADFFAPPTVESGKKVAIVGAGPAGMTAACHLRMAGHTVTVYDRMAEAGGMLRYCIPAYRLPKDVLKRQVEAFARMGITFRQGVEIGDAVALENLRQEHDRVFMAIGGWRQKTLSLENGELLSSGLDFLVEVVNGWRRPPGRKVLVIGGGSVAVDVAISAKRLGATDVIIACLEARDVMPAIPQDIEQTAEENIRLLPSWGPQRVVARDGRLVGLQLMRCTSVFDCDGRFQPTFDPAATMFVEADCVLVAIGQVPDLSCVDGVLKTQRGLILADPDTQVTSLPEVYAGGDAVTGPSTVVAAIAAGRRAAVAIDAALNGGAAKAEEERRATDTLVVNQEALVTSRATRGTVRPVSARGMAVEDVATLDLQAIETEARRCANCGCVAVNASDLAPALLALEATITTTERSLAAQDFFGIGVRSTTVLAPGELVTGISVPAQPAGCVQSYLKFRIRNAIDFPIVGLATVLTVENGRFARARMALGAVAPTPLQMREVEQFLVGRKPDEETAEVAASIAVHGMQPLAGNAFKVAIVRALVKKAILGAAGSAGAPPGSGADQS